MPYVSMKKGDEMDFTGKTVFVTGGASGIGKDTAVAFAAAGAKVAIATAHSIEAGEAVVRSIKEAGGEAMFLQMDTSEETQVASGIARIVETWGRLDIAFNNAGRGPDGVRIPFRPLAELEECNWDKVMDTNMKGTFFCLKHEIRQMLQQPEGGAIVNTTSSGGLAMNPGFGAYGPSKAGVIALTKLAAIEYGRQNIRVNAVCPGPTKGTMLMDHMLVSKPEEEELLTSRVIPMGKIGTTQDIAKAVMWLCSEDAGHITGVNLSVDGGVHLN